MNRDYLKLTAYFGERLRTHAGGAGRFTADALLDLYGSESVATSIMLRGIASFGPHDVLRSDVTLSMSEDPPVAVIAVDTAERIAGLADQAVAMTARGLITLERAQLVTPPAVPSLPGTTRLTVYVGRRHRVGGRPAHQVVCDILHRHGFFGATVFLGVDGTVHGQRRRAEFFSRNADVPVMIVAVGTGECVERALPELRALPDGPLYTVERAQLCKNGGRLIAPPVALPATDAHGLTLWQKLMVHTSEADRHHGQPIHRAIVARLRESRAAGGATVLRGVWGFRDSGPPHGDELVQLGRQVPVTTVVIDTPERIAASFEIVDQLTARHGLVTCEMVPALTAIDDAPARRRGGMRLASHDY